jgi:hypothetical protein
MNPRLEAARAVACAAALSSCAAGCSGRGSYDPLPTQRAHEGLLAAFEARPPRAVTAARGVLACHVHLRNDSGWDFSLIPMWGSTSADLEVRITLGDLRVRTPDDYPSSDNRVVEVPDVAIEPGTTLSIELVDLDDYFHDPIDTHTLEVAGSWPLSAKSTQSTVTCDLVSPEFLKNYAGEAASAATKLLAEAEASFDPRLRDDTFGLHGDSPLGVLIRDLYDRAWRGEGVGSDEERRLEEAERRWLERARARVGEVRATAPALGEPVALGEGGLEVIGFPAACAYDAGAAASELGVADGVLEGGKDDCLIEAAIRNTGEEPVTLEVTLSQAPGGPTVSATRGDAKTPLALAAHTAGGFSAEVFVVAAGRGDQLKVAPTVHEQVLASGESITLHLATRAGAPRMFEQPAQGDVVVLMRSGEVVWRTTP